MANPGGLGPGPVPAGRPAPVTVVAVLLELTGGQLQRFALAKPVTLRAGRDRGRLVIEVVGEKAWLTDE